MIVLQAGTWNTTSMPRLGLVLADVDAMLDTVRVLRAAEATRRARILLISLPSQSPALRTTGIRTSWAHAAINAYIAHRVAAEPLHLSSDFRGSIDGFPLLLFQLQIEIGQRWEGTL